MDNFKGYVLTIIGGLLLLICLIFVSLQGALTSEVSLFGYKFKEANTALVVLASAAGGVLMVYVLRLFFKGVWILHKIRSARETPARQAASPKPAEPNRKDDEEHEESDSNLFS